MHCYTVLQIIHPAWMLWKHRNDCFFDRASPSVTSSVAISQRGSRSLGSSCYWRFHLTRDKFSITVYEVCCMSKTIFSIMMCWSLEDSRKKIIPYCKSSHFCHFISPYCIFKQLNENNRLVFQYDAKMGNSMKRSFVRLMSIKV